MKRLALSLAIFFGILVQPDIVRAQERIPSSDGTIFGCYQTHKNPLERQGNLRLVSDPALCKSNESVVSWNADDFGFSQALCELEVRMKSAVPSFPIKEECIPPEPDAPVLTELVIQSDGSSVSLLVSGIATPNTTLVPYIGDNCQQNLSVFLGGLGVTGVFEILIGPDPNFEVELALPPEVIDFIPVIQLLAPVWTAKSRDALGQVSACSPEAIDLVVNNP